MTTTTKTKASQSRTRRKPTTTPKTMTETPYPTKVRKYKHTEPVVIDSHLDEVQVISTAAYIQDFKNRAHLNNVEVKELFDQHVEIYNHVQPHVVNAFTKVVDYVKSLRKQ